MLTIFHGAYALCSSEHLGEIAERGETQELCDLGHGQIRFRQQIFTLLNSAGDHVIDRGDAILPLKGM